MTTYVHRSYMLAATVVVASFQVSGADKPMAVSLGPRALSFVNGAAPEHAQVYEVRPSGFSEVLSRAMGNAAGMSDVVMQDVTDGVKLVEDEMGRQMGYNRRTSTYYFDDPRMAPEGQPLSEAASLAKARQLLAELAPEGTEWVHVSTDVESLIVAGEGDKARLSKRMHSFARKLSGRLVLSAETSIDIALNPSGEVANLTVRAPELVPHHVAPMNRSRQSVPDMLAERVQQLISAQDTDDRAPVSILVHKAIDSYRATVCENKTLLVPYMSAVVEVNHRDGTVHELTLHTSQYDE